ncbi:hypothetical protein FJR48_05695 [Sulfurimonas lithotrophica]|uniref:Uncharacterized protein n=1 Tax=Sulfurimonas lithotrophica TaxID=2590022 RepID=A0A5P8P0K8_9BACT|nr:hypothetical protein [Sulfurimonas lithotrophica]QFR49248.1 hypothetical protein FJR48_05695 [Sulfurimonas lithotrophica]
MSFEQRLLEHDFNPFVLFSSDGKILSLNEQAQFIVNPFNSKELFELATTYANVTFGFKTTFVDVEFSQQKFFGLTVGYENEDEIGIKLYQKPSFKLNNKKPTGELTNIYTLVDLCISTNSINSDATFSKEFDPTIPEIIIDSNSFIKILNKIYSCFIENESINTKIYYRIGEHIIFDSKKYSLFSIEISSQNQDKNKISELQNLVDASNIHVDIQKKITINLPMITE